MKRLFLLAPLMASLLSCAHSVYFVREKHVDDKISHVATVSSMDKFRDSGFRSYISYRTTSRSDFDMHYFTSVDYSFSTQTGYLVSQTRYIINSSKMLPRENLITMGSLFSDALATNDGRATLRFYSIEDETLISRKYSLEMSFPSALLEGPGQLKATGVQGGITLSLRNREGAVLYYLDGQDADCFAELETTAAAEGIVAAKLSASLRSSTGDSRYNVKDAEFWIRL